MSTSIQWTDDTWNPVRGCSMAKGSEAGGCKNCYAARMAARNLPELRSPTSGEPFAVMRDSGPRWTGKVELIESALGKPLHWRKPRRIFVNSMSDLFHEQLPDSAIDRVFAVMALCPQHTFQVLTKRPERMLKYITDDSDAFRSRTDFIDDAACEHGACHANLDDRWPLPNVWLGVSVEGRELKWRIDVLRKVPSAVRFISIEPLLEDIGALDLTGIDWVIVGGESGPGARRFETKWARDVLAQCKAAGVACFVKQMGSNAWCNGGGKEWRLETEDKKGGNWHEWPSDLRVREFPRIREIETAVSK